MMRDNIYKVGAILVPFYSHEKHLDFIATTSKPAFSMPVSHINVMTIVDKSMNGGISSRVEFFYHTIYFLQNAKWNFPYLVQHGKSWWIQTLGPFSVSCSE